MSETVVRKAGDRRRVTIDCSEGDRTQQSFKDECDVNALMKKFERDGLLDHVNRLEGRYGDFGTGDDFHSSMIKVQAAQEMFMTLPAKLRAEFVNDAGAFLDWFDGASEEDLREKGLLPPVKAPTAAQPPVEPSVEVPEAPPE